MRHYIIEIIAVSAALILSASCNKQAAETAGSDEIQVIPTLEETKATLIPAGDLTSCRIHLDGYLAGTETKHLDGNILYKGGKWSFYTSIENVHYYWPQKSNLDVMAYSPAKLDSTHITIVSSKQIKCTKLPMIDSLQADKKFNELVVGYKAGCKKSDGAIKIKLYRPYASVRFHMEEAVRSTLNYIKIDGLYSTGTFTYSSGSFSWGNLADKADLYCGVHKVYPTEINNKSPLGGPFLVIPQDLPTTDSDAIKLVFSYRSTGNTKDTITETTIGTAKDIKGNSINKWEAGKDYDYWITLNGAANEVRMAVTISEWDIQGSSETEVK